MDDRKKVVLIAEDEPPMLRILSDKLGESGFDIIQTHDGEEGLAVSLSKHPDLVLLDVLMPKVDGMTMMNSLRKDPWGKTVPIVVLTNVSPDRDETLQAIIKDQPAYYFVKSNTKLEDIIEKVKEILSSEKKE